MLLISTFVCYLCVYKQGQRELEHPKELPEKYMHREPSLKIVLLLANGFEGVHVNQELSHEDNILHAKDQKHKVGCQEYFA